ncbi:hypothetical protein BDB00DRAFT_875631 [Zychaea mexicana]|uniref:uncharacterized protein n=1 Tax=Zychaea mexicana TaxID=64656 RepID=UPI0022FF36D9|nr:uncharacterized protein BDB00DRAFT_875631 [Zychaea mexicana]KAI9490176.1 hypothetical protein BDB00DRAFT_875631 [Zychaea mexicana]
MTKLSNARDLLGMVFLPIMNVVLSLILMGLLIYVYINANGQPLDYTMGKMKIPSVISLLTTLLKMCIAGGIGYAVSEYKWVRLQDGGALSLLDVYDACTRGVGGAIRVMLSIRLDYIILPAVIFQLGLITIGPATQVVLTTYADQTNCTSPTEMYNGRMHFNNFSLNDLSSFGYPFDQRLNYGLKKQYVVIFGFDSTPYQTAMPLNYWYMVNSTGLTFADIPMFYTDIECQDGTFDETQIISPTTRTAITLAEFYGSTQPVAPRVYYAGSMYNRTIYDIQHARVPSLMNDEFNPALRAFVGDQTFVALSHQGRASKETIERPEDAFVQECTIRTHMALNNITTGTGGGFFFEPGPREPIEMDYDLLINSSFWYDHPLGPARAMQNAYAYQLTLMAAMTGFRESAFQDRLADTWASNNPDRNTLENFLRAAFNQSDVALSIVNPTTATSVVYAHACYPIDPVYTLNAPSFYTVSLIAILPLLWWVIMWIISLYQTNGVSRGNSQIALLVTGFTKKAAEQFKGYSHAGQRTLFQKASTVDVTFGEVKRMDNKSGHIAFGLENELHPLRARRRSISRA